MISVVQLGTIDYATGLRLQQQLVALRKEEKIGDVLLLLEHSPVITLGRNAKAANIIALPELLARRGVELCECGRGGDVTCHGPGQIVGYPIFDLRGFATSERKRKTLGAIEYVRKLEDVLIRTCTDFGVSANPIPGLTGVWTAGPCRGGSSTRPDGAEPRPHTEQQTAKIAAIGVHISRAVTSHGFALNVNTDLSYFDLIVPCGLESKPVTSMEKELGKQVPPQDVARSISRNFSVVFDRQILWLESLDTLLSETIGVPMRPPAELRKIHGDDDTTWA